MRFHWIRLLILLQFSTLQQSALATDFAGANLSGAHLTNADLRGSNLRGANLTDANLSNTDLTGTNVTQLQLDSACGSAGTKLPAGLKIEPCTASPASGLDPSGYGQGTTADQALLEAVQSRNRQR